jgi:hypothetical protein
MHQFIRLPLLDGSEETVNVRYILSISRLVKPGSQTPHSYIEVIDGNSHAVNMGYDDFLSLLQQHNIEIIKADSLPTV